MTHKFNTDDLTIWKDGIMNKNWRLRSKLSYIADSLLVQAWRRYYHENDIPNYCIEHLMKIAGAPETHNLDAELAWILLRLRHSNKTVYTKISPTELPLRAGDENRF